MECQRSCRECTSTLVQTVADFGGSEAEKTLPLWGASWEAGKRTIQWQRSGLSILGLQSPWGSLENTFGMQPAVHECMHAMSLQSRLTLCDTMNCSLPGSSVHGIFQARTVEWVATSPLGNLLNPGIEPVSLMSPALAGGFFTTSPTQNRYADH